MKEAKKVTYSITKFLSHPLTGFGVGILGIGLAIYFYIAGDKEPKLMFLAHPIRTSIVQAGKLTDVSVLLRGQPINGDLTAAQFIIWNAGKAPIRHEDILKPIFLSTVSNYPIYEVSIRNVSRDVTKFQIITNEIATGRLGLDWKILEQNDGASIQILYGGNQNLKFYDEGVVVGQDKIPFQVLNLDNRSMTKNVIFAGILCLLIVAMAKWVIDNVKGLNVAIHARKWGDIIAYSIGIMICSGLLTLFCTVIFLIFARNNSPPFEF